MKISSTEEFLKNPDFVSVIGSRLYGVSSEDSDVDLRGFVVPPQDYILGFKKFEQYEDPTSDSVIYSLKKFLDMLINGNSQALECVFSNQIRKSSEYGNIILENRNLFVSKRYYRNIRGFAFAEYRKARCVQLEIAPTRPKLEEAFHVISSCLSLKRYERDVVISLLEDITGEPIKFEVPNKKVGERRSEDFKEFGYCRKNYYNTIRLLSQGIELFNTGQLTFPRPEVEYLKQIRAGTLNPKDIEEKFAELDNQFAKLNESSDLPDNPDLEKITQIYINIIRDKHDKEIAIS